MDFLLALSSLAAQHPSTPIVLEIEFLPDVPIWEAAIMLLLGDGDGESPAIAIGNGATAQDALADLHSVMLRTPCR